MCILRVGVQRRGPRQAAWCAGASQAGKQEPRLLSVLGHGPSPSQPHTLFPETGEIGGRLDLRREGRVHAVRG